MRSSPVGNGRQFGAAATSPIKRNEETYQPTTVAGCEMAKESRSNMCASSARFARTAITRAMPLTARSLLVKHVVSEHRIDSLGARIPFWVSNSRAFGLGRGTVHYDPPVHHQGADIKRRCQWPKRARDQREESRRKPPSPVFLSAEVQTRGGPCSRWRKVVLLGFFLIFGHVFFGVFFDSKVLNRARDWLWHNARLSFLTDRYRA